jgi:coatomer subunit beta
MLIMISIVRVGQSKFAAIPIDEDSQERIMNCVETLAKLQASASVKEIFLHDTKAAYAKMVATEEKKALEKKAKESKTTVVQADDLISFRQFNKKAAAGDMDDVGVEKAIA